MCRWNVLVYLLLLQHISSQPITDSNTNDRPTRQLDFDFEECCPCLDKGNQDRDVSSEEPLAAASEGVSARQRDLGQCPCRDQGTDSQGAASVFFPTAMRSAGTFLRTGEKKDDLKPILNPEVNLASSVLQTLREVTDEEYQNALARDAAKAKMAEDILTGDANPQESADIVTIVVSPAASEDDDVIPQASHIQTSRCIHPLQTAGGKMRIAEKPNLFRYKPRASKVKPALLHHIWDNGMGASNVNEQIVPFRENVDARRTNTSPLRIIDNLNVKQPLSNIVDEDYEGNDPRQISEPNNIFELKTTSLLHSLRNKIDSSLSRNPKKFKNLPEEPRISGDDLSSASSIINEQTSQNVPFFKTNSLLQSIRQKTRPLSLPNILNLKDVEIIPPGDSLIKKYKIKKPKHTATSNFDDTQRVSNKDFEDPQSGQHFPNYNIIEGSSRTVPLKNEQITDDNCDVNVSERNAVTNIIKQNDLQPDVTEHFYKLVDIKKDLPKETLLENRVYEENTDQDSVIDASNNINNIIEQGETRQENNVQLLEDQQSVRDESPDEKEGNTSTTENITNNHESNSEFKLLDPSLVDKTISDIKEKIAKKIEHLKKIKSSNINKAANNRESNNSDPYNEEAPLARNVNSNQDCQDVDHENADQDSKTDSSKHINNIAERQNDEEILEDQNRTPDESCEKEKNISTVKQSTVNNSNNSKFQPLNTILPDKTMRNLKENRARKTEDFNNYNNGFQNEDTNNRAVYESEQGIKGASLDINANPDQDCQDVDTENMAQDSITDASNHINNIITKQRNDEEPIEDQQREPDEFCDEEDKDTSTTENSLRNNKNSLNLLDPSLVDKTMTNVKESIARKIEDLKNIKNVFRNKDASNREVYESNQGIKEALLDSNENPGQDSQDEDNANINEDSLTDASNHINNVIEERNDGTSLEDQKIIPDESCDEEKENTPTDKISTNDNNAKLNLLDASLVDRTISNKRENLARRIEHLKNLKNNSFRNKDAQDEENFIGYQHDSDTTVSRNENSDQDCLDGFTTNSLGLSSNNLEDVRTTISPDLLDKSEDSEALRQDSFNDEEDIITSNSNTMNDSIVDASENSDKVVSLADLQKLSDSMLQQEEQKRDSENIDRTKFSDEVTEERFTNRNKDELDFVKSTDTSSEIVEEPMNSINLRENGNEVGTCKSNLQLSESSAQSDANVEASEVVVNIVPKTNDIFRTQTILEPTQNLLKSTLPVINNALKLPPLDPLPGVEDMKEKLSNLFDSNNRDMEGTLSSDLSKIISRPQDSLKPVMTSSASTSSFQSRVPSSRLLEEINLHGLKLRSQSSILSDIPKIGLQSYKTKLQLPKDLSLKPIKLQSVLDNRQSLLSSTSLIGDKNNRLNWNKLELRPSDKSNIFNTRQRIADVKERLSDIPFEETRHIHSTLRNTQKAFESKLRQAANKNLNFLNTPSSSLLDSLSKNHDDISDKLKGLQIDLNDRLETMHNELIDRSKLLTSSSRNSKQNLSNISKPKTAKQPLKHTWQASTRRESQKTSTPRRTLSEKPVKIMSPSKTVKQKTFRMPGAASVPVPSTIQVPELKPASVNSRPLTLRRDASAISNWNTEKLQTKAPVIKERLSSTLPSTSSILRKPFNSKKDTKVVLSFSTTPRSLMHKPLMHNSNTGESQNKFATRITNEDHDGSPSELKMAIVTDHNINELSSQKSVVDEEGKLKAPALENLSTKNTLLSWPRPTESAFLKKVREAVQTRLSKVNSPKSLKPTNARSYEVQDNTDIKETSDMVRSASENEEVIEDAPLRENVSYKCKMVCTKE